MLMIVRGQFNRAAGDLERHYSPLVDVKTSDGWLRPLLAAHQHSIELALTHSTNRSPIACPFRPSVPSMQTLANNREI